MAYEVRIQTEDFDLSQEIAVLRSSHASVGAVCAFVGTVRDRNLGDEVSSMELEHYPGMTEKSIEHMLVDAHKRFDIISSNNRAIQFSILVDAGEKEDVPLHLRLNSKQKFERIAEQYPLVQEFKTRLNLEILY